MASKHPRVQVTVECGFGVLHDDSHFDLLATVLEFESVRLPE